MIRFRDHLGQKLKNNEFAKGFEKELQFARLAVEIAEARENQKLTQSDLASKAHITQQQLSKVENAMACKVETLLKVCNALGMDLVLRLRKSKVSGVRTSTRRGIKGIPPKRVVRKALVHQKQGAAKRSVRD
jgi:HTH-type transcriptional regulator/antitoxin HipB